MMQWKKDPGTKYVDLCIYVDKNVPLIAEHMGEYEEIENKVYNYLWLIVKALAIKKRMFQRFDEYDGYAFYAASRLYFALRKNYLNQGKVIKGKQIKPIKSCLNYMKALLYPMKVEYQRETYNEVISEEFVSKKFDAFAYRGKLHEEAVQNQTACRLAEDYINEVITGCGDLIEKVLDKSPFAKGSIDYKKLKISLMLNCLHDLKNKSTLDGNPTTIVLWKLPKSISNYMKVLIKEFYTDLKVELMDCFESTRLSENILDKLISVPDGDYKDYED